MTSFVTLNIWGDINMARAVAGIHCKFQVSLLSNVSLSLSCLTIYFPSSFSINTAWQVAQSLFACIIAAIFYGRESIASAPKHGFERKPWRRGVIFHTNIVKIFDRLSQNLLGVWNARHERRRSSIRTDWITSWMHLEWLFDTWFWCSYDIVVTAMQRFQEWLMWKLRVRLQDDAKETKFQVRLRWLHNYAK